MPSQPIAREALPMQAVSSLRLRRYTRYLPIYPYVTALFYSRAYLYEAVLLCGRLYLYLAALRRGRLICRISLWQMT